VAVKQNGVIMPMMFLWVMSLRGLVDGSQCFREACSISRAEDLKSH
jgi:hypothetical protein